jgi:hypothetical protein
MNLLIVVSDDVHRTALLKARKVGNELTLPAGLLNAPLDDDASTWISNIWDVVESAIQRAYREGMAAAQPLIDQASIMLTNLTQKAKEVRTVISERLNVYLQSAIDGALQRVRAGLSIGGSELKLQRVTVEQRINMSGSVKASLAEVCAFVAEGSISLSAEYSIAQ